MPLDHHGLILGGYFMILSHWNVYPEVVAKYFEINCFKIWSSYRDKRP
jgi:hypothetical protein